MALFSAVAARDIQKLQSRAQDFSADGGVDLNCTDIVGKTISLHIASDNGHLDIVKYLIEKGAELDKCDNGGRTPLYQASLNGHLEIVDYLVGKGSDMKKCDKKDFTAIHVASLFGHLDIVKYLVSKGAELENLAHGYWTPLHLALDGGHFDIVEYLLHEGANINKCGKTGMTTLHTASQTGNIDGVKYIITQGAEIDGISLNGWTPLSLASDGGHLDVVKYLIEKGAGLDKCDYDMTPLQQASEAGRLQIVEYLVNEGADIEKSNKNGRTALYIASFSGHLDIVKYLVEKGAQLDKCDHNDMTPLHQASHAGHLDIVEYLVNKGADIEICDREGFTALHTASSEGYLDIVKYLVGKGADIDKCDNYNWTPLHNASEKGHLKIVEYLVNEGAHIEKSNKNGLTAICLASFCGHLDIVKYLVAKGAELDKCDNNNGTPLHNALRNGHLKIVEYLVNAGADMDKCDKDGFTALHLASYKGHLDIVKYYVHKGAELEKLSNDHCTPLHLALYGRHIAVFEYLVSEGAVVPVQPYNESEKANERTKSSGTDESARFVKEEGTGHFTQSTEIDDIVESQIFRQPSDHMNVEPMNPLTDISLSGENVMQRQSHRDPVKSTKVATSIRHERYNIQVLIPPSDAYREEDVTVEALTNIPPELILEKDEVIITAGLKLSPPGLYFKSPVEVTVMHSATYTNPKRADIVLYTRRTSSDEFSRIVPSTDGLPRCIVRKRNLTLYIDHFSEWWIISYIRRYFIGKRLICTPYVPILTSRDVKSRVFLIIKDDFNGTKEDDIPGHKVAFPGEQYSVRWREGPLAITYLVNEEEVSTKTLEECAFYDMTTHRIPFILQPRNDKLTEILVTFILKQKITKEIIFPVRYADHESQSATSSPTRSASARAESLDVGRGTFYDIRHQSQSAPSNPGRSSRAQSLDDGRQISDERSEVMSPRSTTSSPEVLEQEHVEDITNGDLPADIGADASTTSVVSNPRCLSTVVGDEGMTEVMAQPALAANILQGVAPGLPVDLIHQRQGNVAIYVREINITNPQGNTGTPGPVPVASIVPPRLQHELRCRLNRESPVFDDWRGLATQLELDDYIKSLEQCKNPTEELIVLAESRKKIQNLEDLAKAFHRMNRGDCEELCLNYALEGKRTMSADAHSDQIEGDDTDSSDY